MGHFLTDMSNRVEHQKRNQPAIEKWPFGFAFGVQLGLRQIRALIKTKENKLMQVVQLWYKWGAFTEGPSVNAPHFSHNCTTCNNLLFLVLISARVCQRPSWTPKTKPNGHFSMAGWFRFWCSTRLLMSVKKCPIWRSKPCKRKIY